MKVCYFIQTHRYPKQIYKLVRTIKQSSPTAQVLIGHDFTSCHLDMTPLKDLSEVYLLRGNVPALRGEFSLLQPYFNAINWLSENNSDFDWLVYLSGQDYPTQPLSTIENFLSTTDYDGFMQYFDVFSEESLWDAREALKRYFCQYYRLPAWFESALKIMWKLNIQDFTPIRYYFGYGTFLIGLSASLNPFNKNFICYGGSQWHTLSKECVKYLMNYINSNKNLGVINYYKRTALSDESFVQTILINSKCFRICNDNKRYIDFSKSLASNFGRPRMLTENDYSMITNHSFHFARKFEQDAEILNMLDAHIFQFGCQSKPQH